MTNATNTNPAIVQNLKDAGCDDELIAKYVSLQAKGKTDEQLRILACHRCRLINIVHENQKRVDCLDYLIYAMKKGAQGQKR